jgi:hypothetical protein
MGRVSCPLEQRVSVPGASQGTDNSISMVTCNEQHRTSSPSGRNPLTVFQCPLWDAGLARAAFHQCCVLDRGQRHCRDGEFQT